LLFFFPPPSGNRRNFNSPFRTRTNPPCPTPLQLFHPTVNFREETFSLFSLLPSTGPTPGSEPLPFVKIPASPRRKNLFDPVDPFTSTLPLAMIVGLPTIPPPGADSGSPGYSFCLSPIDFFELVSGCRPLVFSAFLSFKLVRRHAKLLMLVCCATGQWLCLLGKDRSFPCCPLPYGLEDVPNALEILW